jgi:uncharacterized protein with HEPN domain
MLSVKLFMSDSNASREWRFYIDDMIGFCERVLAFTQGVNTAEFVADLMRYDATVRNIELIGEAATRIPDAVRTAYPDMPWRMIIATRNQLVHGYAGIDEDVVWSIVQTDIPALLNQLRALKAANQFQT